MSRFWSDHVAGLAPYVAGEQPKISNLLKLNTNENPYGPSPQVVQAIVQASGDALKLYPDPESSALRQAIAAMHGLQPGQVFVGNGSDEVLAHIFNGLFRRGGKALCMPDITYSFYRTYCQLYDIPAELIPLADDFSLRASDYTQPGGKALAGIIFANPNAPTGIGMALSDISAIARANPDIPVVVDEAYVDFGAESAIPLLETHPNLVVVHTFSKSRSLAGLRVGFAMAGAEIIDGLNRIKDSFNSYPLDRLAQAGALASINDHQHFETTRQAVIASRHWLSEALAGLGFQVLPSLANFVFARHPDHDAQAIAKALRQHGVLVRHFSKPRIDHYLRISVGTPQECQRLVDTLHACLPLLRPAH
jgi:histidinol-phosphate aminotransferase